MACVGCNVLDWTGLKVGCNWAPGFLPSCLYRLVCLRSLGCGLCREMIDDIE